LVAPTFFLKKGHGWGGGFVRTTIEKSHLLPKPVHQPVGFKQRQSPRTIMGTDTYGGRYTEREIPSLHA